jgi:hypothetical protein
MNERFNVSAGGASTILHSTIKVEKEHKQMNEQNPIRSFEKIRRIYSERRHHVISVRVSYDVTNMNGGQLVQLKKMEIVDQPVHISPMPKIKKYS